MSVKEIGSEFWKEDLNSNIKSEDSVYNYLEHLGKDRRLLLSGRTAIDLVINEIKKNKKIKSIYLPSYCCDTMIKPFKKNNIKIEFYKVYFENGLKYDIDINKKIDVFFAMNYFGFDQSNMDNYIDLFKSKGKTIIEDSTQCILNNRAFNSKSDFIVSSLRKWFPIASGGIAINNNQMFSVKQIKRGNEMMIKNKLQAMELKKQYIDSQNGSKDIFLELYRKSNNSIENEYSNISIDYESLKVLKKIDINFIKNLRYENAKVIIEGLKNNNCRLMFDTIKFGEYPLFIPVIANKSIRNSLSNYLVENKIFCPIHWPKPMSEVESNIYETEISLICDQRYSREDMNKEVSIINSFNNKLI